MTPKIKKRIHLTYGIVLSIVTIFAGICFIAACLNIYYGGKAADVPQIYTRQIVAENFAKISVPVYACLILVIGGMVLDMAVPVEKSKRKSEKNWPLILARLQEQADLESCDAALRAAAEKERKLRKNLIQCSGILLLGGLALFLIHACNSANWDTDSNPGMIRAMFVMLSSLTVPFLFTILATYQNRKSMAREAQILHQMPKKAKHVSQNTANTQYIHIVRIAILLIGVVLVVLGACTNGTADILTKAVNICTECVGLG